ncbi:hypothetical protein HaLaN_32447 [Haematococcus lacustris]|uniref:Uncharacterized protein n=1 Tax=Haematococcus lacustris TaxID=44745 RepID=A0A6A0AMF3_HAELA|nr:hypothetical protein HaLaN_32447 [Haematococcus lacustris]
MVVEGMEVLHRLNEEAASEDGTPRVVVTVADCGLRNSHLHAHATMVVVTGQSPVKPAIVPTLRLPGPGFLSPEFSFGIMDQGQLVHYQDDTLKLQRPGIFQGCHHGWRAYGPLGYKQPMYDHACHIPAGYSSKTPSHTQTPRPQDSKPQTIVNVRLDGDDKLSCGSSSQHVAYILQLDGDDKLSCGSSSQHVVTFCSWMVMTSYLAQ